MIGTARNFMILAVAFLWFGIAVGLIMAIGGDHAPAPAHAHIMLAGWVSQAIFAFFYHIHQEVAESVWGRAHFILQAIATTLMTVSVLLLYNGHPGAEPGAAIGSLAFAGCAILFTRNTVIAFRKA